jgi:hypothetical protein
MPFGAAANLSATAVQMQAVATVIFPVNSVRPGCPMYSANGGLTTTYSTPAAENNTFVFDDFLPPTAILTNVGISLSLLGDGCPNPDPIVVYLNQGYPGVALGMTIGTGYSGGDSTPNCQTPGQFEEIGRMGPSMLTPDIAPYVRNGPNAITVDEPPNGSCSQFIEYVVVYLVYYDSNDLPLISFDLSATSSEDQRKVLMHRWRSEAAYPYLSSFQVAAAQNDAGRDGHIQINATVTDASGTPLPGMDLFVRTVDPPDPSTYLPPAESHWGDNPWGLLSFLIPYVPEPSYGWHLVTSDGNGRISLPLPVGGQGIPSTMPAGDNVQIQASAIFLPFVSPTRCTPALGCYMGGVITSWRRVYIERDRMFRKGTFLVQNAAHGATILSVSSIADFGNASTNNPISAILIHGDSESASSPQNYLETVYVKKAAGGKLTLTQPLRYDYFAANSSVNPSLWAGDAIGKYASDADLYPTDLSLAVDFFGAKTCQNPPACDSLYTDFMVLAEGSAGPNPPIVPNMVPYIPFISSCTPTLAYCLEIAERFFGSRSGRQTLPGHQHFISSASDSIDIQNWSGSLGNTCKDADAICRSNGAAGTVLIYNVAIGWTGLSLTPMLQEISAHELAHTFDVNQANAPDYGHCTSQQPQPGGPMASNQSGHCLMNANRTNQERTDGRIGFHVSPWETSEYRRIRARPDPIPQTWQSTFLPNP